MRGAGAARGAEAAPRHGRARLLRAESRAGIRVGVRPCGGVGFGSSAGRCRRITRSGAGGLRAAQLDVGGMRRVAVVVAPQHVRVGHVDGRHHQTVVARQRAADVHGDQVGHTVAVRIHGRFDPHAFDDARAHVVDRARRGAQAGGDHAAASFAAGCAPACASVFAAEPLPRPCFRRNRCHTTTNTAPSSSMAMRKPKNMR